MRPDAAEIGIYALRADSLAEMDQWIDGHRRYWTDWPTPCGRARSPAGSDEVHPADVATCEHLGYRVATVTRQMVAGRAAAPSNSAASTPQAWSAPAR